MYRKPARNKTFKNFSLSVETYVIDEQNMKTQTEPNQKDGHYHEEVEGRSEDVLEPREGRGGINLNFPSLNQILT